MFDYLLSKTRKKERDVLCTMAITMCDLYPEKDGQAWNFVFGQARLMDGIGIFSFSRYLPHGGFLLRWTGQPVSSGCSYDDTEYRGPDMSAEARSVLLRRSCKVLAHETCHIFGIKHCIHFDCLMCGANNLEEADRHPLFLCPIDLRKLQNSLGFDVEERYMRMSALLETFGW